MTETNSITSFIEQAEKQSRWDSDDVISTGVAVGYLYHSANLEGGHFDALVSSEFMATFPKKDHWVLTALLHACAHLAKKLAEHVDGDEPASMESFELAITLSRAMTRLATMVGHGYARIASKREVSDPERPQNITQRMLLALYELNELPTNKTVMEASHATH